MDAEAIAQRYSRERDLGRHPSVPGAWWSGPVRDGYGAGYGIVTAMTVVWPRSVFSPFQ